MEIFMQASSWHGHGVWYLVNLFCHANCVKDYVLSIFYNALLNFLLGRPNVTQNIKYGKLSVCRLPKGHSTEHLHILLLCLSILMNVRVLIFVNFDLMEQTQKIRTSRSKNERHVKKEDVLDDQNCVLSLTTGRWFFCCCCWWWWSNIAVVRYHGCHRKWCFSVENQNYQGSLFMPERNFVFL